MSTRREHDLLGDRDVPADAYYGVHTLRAIENFPISGTKISIYPDLIAALASIKLCAARSNLELGLLDGTRAGANRKKRGPEAASCTGRWPVLLVLLPELLHGQCTSTYIAVFRRQQCAPLHFVIVETAISLAEARQRCHLLAPAGHVSAPPFLPAAP